MDVEMVATIAWCLMAAVVVGAVLMYACMHGLVTRAYEEGRQDSLDAVPTAAPVVRQKTPTDATPTTSPQTRSTSAA